MKKPMLKPLIGVASILLWCALNLHAQTAPTITTQPVNQTNLPGTTVSFSVAVDGTGPFIYQWQFNGTNLPNNIITTVAGDGSPGYGGDGGAAVNASIYYPSGVAFDSTGNLYIADTFDNRIRKVDTNGIITTFAGAGGQGYYGDGGAATNAALDNPQGVAFDASGNCFIADLYNNRIRKVDVHGIITTVAGNGAGVPNGGAYSGDGGTATNASLWYPSGVAFDASGNLYFADQENSRIRKVDTNGTITTVAGNGLAAYAGDGGAAIKASLNEPSGVTFDPFGNMFIADFGNSRIRKVDANGVITTAAGKASSGFSGDGGAATNASLLNPSRVAFDASDNLYISDGGNSRIRKVATNGIITTVAGKSASGFSGDGGAATNASLYYPKGVACDAAGNLFVADGGNGRIRRVATNGIITTVAGGGSVNPGNGGAATNVSLSYINDVAFDAAGNLYLSTQNTSSIREVHFAGYPTLVLTNVNATNAGNYSVVITSAYGSVTSVVATLTVIVPPQIIASGTNFGFTANPSGNPSGFGFNLSGAVGQTIVVDGSTDLVTWIPLFTNTVGSTPVYFFDPASTNYAGRYYRARLQ